MKKIIALIVALTIVLMTAAAMAETTITVTGSGEVRINADTAIVSLGVNARNKDVLKAQQEVNDSIAAIRETLINAGIAEENINTAYINIYAIYDYNDDGEHLSAYNANSTLAIKVTDVTMVGKIIDLAFAAGANTLDGVSFSASDTTAAEEEAMKKAVESARSKARVLADASSVTIAGIESITEGGVYSYENNVGNVYYSKSMFDMASNEEAAGTLVQSAKLVVSATVNVTFKAK